MCLLVDFDQKEQTHDYATTLDVSARSDGSEILLFDLP